MTIAAFFDIDGTIYRNQLMLDHFKKLITYDVFDPSLFSGEVKRKYTNWYRRNGDFEEYLETMASIYVNALKGLNKEDLEFVSRQTIKVFGERVYRFSRNRIKWHKEQGHKVIFISGGPDFLVRHMAEKYEADYYSATRYLLDDEGNFNGELVPMWESKDKIIQIQKYTNELKINLENSYAYGDTNGDLLMMKMVGNQYIINPNRKLIDSVKEDEELSKTTNVIVERKNVIYNLKPGVTILEEENVSDEAVKNK